MNKTKKEQTNKVTFIDQVWNLLSSVTFAVIVFALISITSIIGTIIEQQAEPQRNILILSRLFGESAAPTIYKIIDALGFTDMYRSWWFISLLFIFAANLLVCSFERLPKILSLLKENPSFLTDEHLKLLPIKREFIAQKDFTKLQEETISLLKRAGYRIHHNTLDGTIQIFAEKNKYSRLGIYITHLSLLLILIGAVIGIYFGFNGYLNLLEGTQSSVIYLRNEKEVPLGFEIRCDDFDVIFYENTDTPKAFTTALTIIENGKEILKKTIAVNEPLKYKGITFYQSSYGFSPSMESLFKFRITSKKSGKTEEVSLKFGESFTIPDTNIKGLISDFSPALAIDRRGRLFTYAETMNNPAVFIEFTEDKKPLYNQWILRRYPETWIVPHGVIEFQDLWKSQYTGLQVRKDPGVWLVYLGFLLMSIGLYIAFFKSHSRIWIKLIDDKGKNTKVSIYGTTNKYKTAFEQKLDKLIGIIKS
ncbi:MAG: cytochrome c biogenesis protein ResB [Thermodesulfovibrionales bacterium]|nr:cytochrome c biogenesis protein ResB [Thermodesulfovibrionales bacterium]